MQSEKKLAYYLPKPEKPHTVPRIPGSHTLYVGPPACPRRHALHAEKYGGKRDVSFLALSESDLALGYYDDLIVSAVGELIEILPVTPHIFFIAVFCVDRFLGTDEKAMLDRLHTVFPDKRFAVSHIDPLTLGKDSTMGAEKNINMYSFLEPVTKFDSGINFIGHYTSLDPECEFMTLLKKWDIVPREIFNCEDYGQYVEMAKSRLNVVLRFSAIPGAEYMKAKLHIPFYFFPVSYDADFVAKGYEDIAELLGLTCPDFTQERNEVKHIAGETATSLNGLPVAIDATAFLMPFAAAKALLGYGFNITHIFRSRYEFDADADARDYIRGNFSHIKILHSDFSPSLNKTDCLAIGSNCARLLNAKYFADVWHDEGYFGFHGIRKLMELLRDPKERGDGWEG